VFNLEAAMASSEETPNETGSSCVYGESAILQPVFDEFASSLSCSLANNHITDYGASGLSNTLDLLKQYNVSHFGAGLCNSDAKKPLILSDNDIRIGLLSVCSDRKCVGDHLKNVCDGSLSILDKTVTQQIKSLKQIVDHVVLICHWGREFVHYPLPEDRVLAKSFIEAGASLIIGHHPHVLQGHEYYLGGLIIYSLGNFIFPSLSSPQILRWNSVERTSAIAIIQFSKSTFKLHSFSPTYLDESNRFFFLKNKRKVNIQKNITKWSTAFTSQNYKTFYDRKMRIMIIQRIAKGVLRNLFYPRREHFIMIYRFTKQLFLGRKYYINE